MFELGKISVTIGAEHALQEAGQDAGEFVARHQNGDWGDVADETREGNARALEQGGRIQSIYHTRTGEKLLVATEPDRKLTSVTLPDER